jgi:predicted Rdx family selenoprotein
LEQLHPDNRHIKDKIRQQLQVLRDAGLLLHGNGSVPSIDTNRHPADAYIFERELEQLHPDNRNIKAKIRQQLQELRDRNLLLHIDRNRWRLP